MSREMVMSIISSFAKSQGFYGRLKNRIEEAEAEGVDLSNFFGQFKNCKNTLDVILQIEQ